MKTYRFDRVRMAQNLTINELRCLELEVKENHRLGHQDGIHIYDKKGLKKLDDIGWAIYHKMKRGEG